MTLFHSILLWWPIWIFLFCVIMNSWMSTYLMSITVDSIWSVRVLQAGFWVFLIQLQLCFTAFLISWITWRSRLILYIPYPSPGINHFSKEPWRCSVEWEMIFRNFSLCDGAFIATAEVTAFTSLIHSYKNVFHVFMKKGTLIWNEK